MRKMRFSIAGLMGFVLIAAVGVGGLKNANEVWASGCFTLMVVCLVAAILNAVQGRGKDRAYWTGFAVAGWAYLLVTFGTMDWSEGTLPGPITGQLFDQLATVIHPGESRYSNVTATFLPTPVPAPAPNSLAPSITITGTLSGISSSSVAPAPAPVLPPAVVTPTYVMMPPNTRLESYTNVAHSLAALLAGVLGGLYSLWLFGRRARREADLAAEVSPSSP